MSDLNPAYIQSIIDHFAPAVTIELDRVEAETRDAFPGCSTFRYTYDVAYHLKTPRPWERGRWPWPSCRWAPPAAGSTARRSGRRWGRVRCG